MLDDDTLRNFLLRNGNPVDDLDYGDSPERQAKIMAMKAAARKAAETEREKNTVRFHPARLAAFAAQHGRTADDLKLPLAHAIKRGRAADAIRALLADKYDDHIAVLVNPDNLQAADIYFTGVRAACQKMHEIEFNLGLADLVTPGTLVPRHYRRSRLFLCFGYEYFDYRELSDFIPSSAEMILCDHCYKEALEMPHVTAPRIWWDEATGSYACVTPFDQTFVDYLKLVDRSDKKFDFESKIWYFSPRVVEEIKSKVKAVFGSCQFAGRQATSTPVLIGSDIFSQFAKLVGLDSLRKAYFDAAKRHHADAGGTGSTMSEINALWKQIEDALRG